MDAADTNGPVAREEVSSLCQQCRQVRGTRRCLASHGYLLSVSLFSYLPSPPRPSPLQNPSPVEVDEEGYSIRPQDAANISQFPDDQGKEDSDSDSDFGDGR